MRKNPSPEGLLLTKIVPPQKRSELVERAQLTARVDKARDTRLLLVCAPAGYGKTSLLAQVYQSLQQAGRHASWISLDESDKDLSRFISYLVDAARRSGLKVAQALATLLGSGTSLPADNLRTLLLNELLGLEEEFYLFLDDYHLIREQAIKDLINAILLSPIRQIRLLIATRHDNDLPVSRLRALGQVHLVEAADLTFSDAEVGQIVEQVRGLPISLMQARRLRESTEGWVASLQMASIAMRSIGDVDDFLDGFSGEHKSIGDFLGEEVLRRQPEDIQEFLVATSILRRFNASLCNALLKRSNARQLIDQVEHRNLFVFSVDQGHNWYRYHHLFSDFLRRRLHERHPDRVLEYHRRASEWLAENHFMTDAIEHAFSANESERAGLLLDSTCNDLFAAGQTATLLSLSSRLPATLQDRLPRLQLEIAWEKELSWKFAEAREALARARHALDERKAAGVARDCPEMIYLEAKQAHREMMLCLLSDDMPATDRQARAWLQTDRTRDAFMCASAGSAVMASNRELFRCEGTATSTRMLHDRFVEGGAFYGIVFHQCIAGATLFARGELEQAHDAYERALQVAVELHGEQSALYHMPAVMLAELCYEQNQLGQAEELLAQRDISSQLGFVDNLIAGFLTRARLLALRGRHAEADGVLGEGAWLAEQYPFPRMRACILHERVRLLIAQGHGKEAAALLRATHTDSDEHLTPSDGTTRMNEQLALATARVWIEQGSAREAIPLLRAWYTFAKARRCYGPAVRSGALFASAMFASGDRRGGQRTLMECLQVGQSGPFVRSFVDEGPDIVAPIAEFSRSGARADADPFNQYLRTIVEAAADPDRQPGAPLGMSGDAATSMRERLSAREIQILELAAQGISSVDISENLCIAGSTVKWYWQRIFEKLDVRRRTDAIKKARAAQWIP